MWWLFRLPGFVYLALAPFVLAFAIYFFIDDQHKEAAKAAERAAKPPAEVTIEKFDAARNTNSAQEAVITGQVDLGSSYELSITKRGAETSHYVLAPIYATTAKDTNAPAIGVLMQEGRLDDEQIKAMAVDTGPAGLLMRIDGKVLSSSDVSGHDREFRDHVQVAPNAVYIDPFENGRGEGLAPSDTGRYAAIVIGVIALAMAAFGLFKHRRTRAERLEAAEAY
ncbi:hypothetical protein [Sphingomonas sp. KR3-1]|uniref:hypothetical protein n=1 Tax=Sphingomonas sp. KR3-1 TaxID=3156611 RepID=UPI0032B459B3